MSWIKVDVEGRTMWESPSGERVADASVIDAMHRSAERMDRSIDHGAGLIAFGFVLGAAAGAICAYAMMA